jgi:hypothetical protein
MARGPRCLGPASRFPARWRPSLADQSFIFRDLTFESALLSDSVDGDMVVRIGTAIAIDSPLVGIHSIFTFSEVFESTRAIAQISSWMLFD